jgi:SHS2 domain-containing protein
MPFKEIHHTADCSIHVWAEDLPTLFSEAAFGLLAVAGITLKGSPLVKKVFSFQSPDPESMLVAFLSEVVFWMEHENVAFNKFTLSVGNGRVEAAMTGSPVEKMEKCIKAVTYHNLMITRTSSGFEVEIVFDV